MTSQAFRPTAKDQGKLSVYDMDKITADKSWFHYTSTLGYESAGVMGVLVEECAKACVSAAADPGPFPEHCVIDFNHLTTSKAVDNASKLLKRAANARGWLHR